MARRLLVVAVILLSIVALVVGTVWIARFFFSPAWGTRPMSRRTFSSFFRTFETDGERIYFTGTSATGPPISAVMPGMHPMPAGRLACASCHGPDGRGGPVRMMMASFEAPDIRYRTLTAGDHQDAHADHPPYSDEDIKRAITQGIDPGGEPLSWVMPRWDLSDDQLEDLLDFLKTLE